MKNTHLNGEEKALALAESSREDWEKTSFLKEMFMGTFDFDLIHPFPEKKGMKDDYFLDFLATYKQFLINEVDSDSIDREGKIPKHIIERLREMRLFGLKIDKKYGGHGFTQGEYNEILKLWIFMPFGGGHVGYINRATKKLARQIFHGMVRHGPRLQNKQQFLFRIVDIATELYVMAASISRARKLGGDAHLFADLFCENARRKVDILFHELWHNSDTTKYKLAQRIEKDEFLWLEDGIISLPDEKKRPLGTSKPHDKEQFFH